MPVGWQAALTRAELLDVIEAVREPLHLVRRGAADPILVARGGIVSTEESPAPSFELLASLPPLYPEWLGDRSFQELHGVRFPYVVGEMANGISGPALVAAGSRAGLLAFLGTAGLAPERIDEALMTLSAELGPPGLPWGANLIHAPGDPRWEDQVAARFLDRGVRRVCASAYVAPTLAVVRYACSGLRRRADGQIHRRHHLFAKVSRAEVARSFLSPAPSQMVQELVDRGLLTPDEAELARHVPLAEDITAEADSGGHTDNRPLTVLLPAILELARELRRDHRYTRMVRVGAAGGIGTPGAAAAAFALGAAYVLVGSVHQSAVEAATSPAVKRLLAATEATDVAMAPSADMFELGAKVQVLRRGSLFAPRAGRLHDLFVRFESLEALPAREVERLEKECFGMPIERVWQEVERFFGDRDPAQIARAKADARYQMALVFRYYLGLSSRWAIAGEEGRTLDYQIWCGPAMGAFNTWVRGSFLEDPANRTVSQIALNILEGAAVLTRAQQLRSFGVAVPPEAFAFIPRLLST